MKVGNPGPQSIVEIVKVMGFRFISVSILPSAILFLSILALILSGPPGETPDLCRVKETLADLKIIDWILLLSAFLVFSFLIQPFQLSMVRILEGYWWDFFPMNYIKNCRINSHKSKYKKLENEAESNKQSELSPVDRARMEKAAWKLHRFYPAENRFLPTALGNVLRAAEDRINERYGLDAVVIWPRLYPLLSEKLLDILSDQRNQLDIAVRFCFVFLGITFFSLAILFKHGLWLAIPIVFFLLFWISYRAAISAALAYGEGIQTAFDLHRFDLLKAFHLKLPKDGEEEKILNEKLSGFLRQGYPKNLTYNEIKEPLSTCIKSDTELV